MSFKTSDFKTTTRTTDGERVLYPYQIKDDRFTASIGYAIAYYERMVGRRRGEFEASPSRVRPRRGPAPGRSTPPDGRHPGTAPPGSGWCRQPAR